MDTSGSAIPYITISIYSSTDTVMFLGLSVYMQDNFKKLGNFVKMF